MHKVIDTQCTCVLFLFVFANQNLSPIDFASSRRAASTPFPSRDQKPVTATLLESAFTNRDARNPFRKRICENCRVSYPFFSILVSRRTFPCKKLICKSLVFYALRTPYPVSPLLATATKIRFSWRGDGEFMPLSAPASPCSLSVPSDERGFS